MQSDRLIKARELLYLWLSKAEKKSFDSIRKTCDYLSQAYNLGLEGYAVWDVFSPLLKTGVVDHVGRDYYAITEPLRIEGPHRSIVTNVHYSESLHRTPFVGVYISDEKENPEDIKSISFDCLSALKAFPCVSNVVDAFPKTVVDSQDMKYYHYKGGKGLTERVKNGQSRFFCIPELQYQREVPGRSVNPDAFNLAYTYSSIINNEKTGRYDKSAHSLYLKSFGFPIMLFRVLFIESILNGGIPEEHDGYFHFSNISTLCFRELNRILYKSIEYE